MIAHIYFMIALLYLKLVITFILGSTVPNLVSILIGLQS